MMRSKFCIFRIDSSKINWPIAATTQFYLIFIPKLAGMRTLPGRGFRSIWNGCIDTMNNLQILACVLKCSMILLRSRILAFARKNSQGLLLFDYHPIQQVPKKMYVKISAGIKLSEPKPDHLLHLGGGGAKDLSQDLLGGLQLESLPI
jgi:hypothetical protein